MASLSGCGDMFDSRHAGTTIETTNGLTARVYLPSGAPAKSIKVFRIDEEGWLADVKANGSIFMDSAETNDSGKFEFKWKDSTHASCLYADVEGFGFLIHKVSRSVIRDKYNGHIDLAKKVSYQGHISDNSAKRIYLAGSPF